MLTIDGQLRIDEDRGVIYFDSALTGSTVLRISSLPKPIFLKKITDGLDIIHMRGCNWNTKKPLYV